MNYGAAHAIKAQQEKLIAETSSEELIDQCIGRLLPILAQDQRRPRMSVPVDFERDDDVFVIERLREIKRRVSREGRSE